MDVFLSAMNYASFGLDEYNIDVDEISEVDPKADQPMCDITLRPHQLSLLHKCIQLENEAQSLQQYPSLQHLPINPLDHFETSIGIMADRVGSGKSYVMLSIILCNNITGKRVSTVKSAAMNQVKFHFSNNVQAIKTSMIVVPHNLSYQWATYITKFGSTLKCKVINKLKHLEDFVKEENALDYDLILTSATYYNKCCAFYAQTRQRLQRVFFDEVDNMNLPGCCRPNANFVWFVTASYGNLLYPRGFSQRTPEHRYVCYAHGLRNTGYLRNIFWDLCGTIPMPLVKVLVVKNSEAYTEMSMQLPSIHHYIIKCKTPSTINILHGLVDRNIIESLNAGDIQTALTYISPSHKGSEGNVITMVIDRLSKQEKNLTLRLNMTSELAYDDERERENERVLLGKRIEEVKRKMEQITERISTNDMCAICLGDLINKTITSCCQNVFCFKCIHLWLGHKAQCPMCKSALMSNMLYVVDEEAGGSNAISLPEEEPPRENELNEQFDKLKNLEILLTQKGGKKILIFSNYEGPLYRVIPILEKLNIRFDFIKGNGDQIRAIVNRYKSNAIDVLLVNVRNYGTGMNLENTTDIVMFHKFDTQIESQVIGRAHRIGRQEPLNVHYLLYDNEITST